MTRNKQFIVLFVGAAFLGLGAIGYSGIAESRVQAAGDNGTIVQPEPRPSYPPFESRKNAGGEREFAGWTRNSPSDWAANPDDPASPRYVKLDFGSQPVDPRQAFDAALERAGIASASNVSTHEIETYEVHSRPGGKGWATAGSTTIEGVPISLFAMTGMEKDSGTYSTELYIMPTSDYRHWGGVMKMLDAAGVIEHMESLPANFAEQVRGATPDEQALVFTHLIDITTMRVFGETMQAQTGLLQTLQGVGKDIETRTHCQSIEGCNFVPGLAPGQGTYSIGK